MGRSRGLEIVLQLTLWEWIGPAFWIEFSLICVGMSLYILRSLLDMSGISVFLSLKALATERGDSAQPRSQQSQTIW